MLLLKGNVPFPEEWKINGLSYLEQCLFGKLLAFTKTKGQGNIAGVSQTQETLPEATLRYGGGIEN